MNTRQSLYLVQFPTSAPLVQVDDFPRGTARSVNGALHIRPGGTKKITQTELEHLKKIKPWGKLIRTIKKVVPKPVASAEEEDGAEPESSSKEKAAATKEAKASEQATKAEKTPKGGANKGGKPKQVADKDGKPAG